MTDGVRIGLTGTPGTGKTTIAGLLSDYSVISVRELAKQHNCLGELDPIDQSREIDVDSLNNRLRKHGFASHGDEYTGSVDKIIIEGHLSHLLPVSAIIVLRCDPAVLQERLHLRKWSAEKIRENVEWELMGGPWIELSENRNNNSAILEVDCTDKSPVDIVKQITDWLRRGSPPTSFAEIDWMDKLIDS